MGLFDSFKSLFKKDETIHPIGDAPLESYNGPPPYIFVSYAHKDAEIVYPELINFNNIGINVFYDEGLPTGDSWFATIEAKIKKATLLVPFISPNTVASKPSRKEIFLAFRSDIPILPIYLRKTELKEGLDYAIGDEQSIFKYAMEEKRYVHYYSREFRRHGFKIKSKRLFGNSDNSLPTYHDKHPKWKPLFSNEVLSSPMPKSSRRNSRKSVFLGNDSITNSKEILTPADNSSKRYIYVSYSNCDIDSVISQIEKFEDCGYNVKFYRGMDIDVSKIHRSISDCSFLVVFISKNSLNSKFVQNEVSYALNEDKPVVPIYLEEVDSNLSSEYLLSNSSGISKYNLTDEEFHDEFIQKFDEHYPKSQRRSRSKIFISYSSQDIETANKVCYVLESNGIPCWIAPRNIISGESYVDQTVDAIKDCDGVILIFSRNADESSYVATEIELAFYQDKPIIPFRIDDSLPTGILEFILKNKFWIDAYPDIGLHLKELLELLR